MKKRKKKTEALRVTQVLALTGLSGDSRFMDEVSRQRGQAVHLAMQFFDEGDLDESSIDPELRGYLSAYLNWRGKQNGMRYEAIELPLANGEGLEGQLDRVIEGTPRTILDFKTGKGAVASWVGLQLAAYGWLYDPKETFERMAVKLHPDGTFTERRFPKEEYERDVSAFKGALCLARWKIAHSR